MRTTFAAVTLLLFIARSVSAADAAKRNEDCFTRILLCGETATGELTNRDCSLTDGSFGDRWALPANQGASVELTAATQGFPARLFLRGDETDTQNVTPPGGAVARATFSLNSPSGNFAALLASDPARGNALGPYSLSLRCALSRPCGFNSWTGCAGQRPNHSPARYMVQAAFADPVSRNEWFPPTQSMPWRDAFAGTYSTLPGEPLSKEALPSATLPVDISTTRC